nr:helix-turn-helix domain-containing protein [Clostridia bacterium]
MMFSKKLKELREKKGWTLDELADKYNKRFQGKLSKGTLSRYEHGKQEPMISVVHNLAILFNVTVDELLGKENHQSPISNDNIKCDVIGNVAAGYGPLAYEDVIDTIDIPRSWFHNQPEDQFFFLSVSGSSMAPYYLDGDIVMVHKQPSVDSGQVAVILFEDEQATLKRVRYRRNEDWFEMIPYNPEYPTKRVEGADIESCRVLGLVWRLIRKVEY